MRAPPNDQLVESRDWLIAMPCAIDNEFGLDEALFSRCAPPALGSMPMDCSCSSMTICILMAGCDDVFRRF